MPKRRSTRKPSARKHIPERVRLRPAKRVPRQEPDNYGVR